MRTAQAEISPLKAIDPSRCWLLGLLILPLTFANAGPTDPLLTNYKTGIDVWFSGERGVDYAEEYFYHDKLIDDHKVVFIKSDTLIHMDHNGTNSRSGQNSMVVIGKDGQDGVPNSGDEGVIRYKIDRDMQHFYAWAPYPSNTPLLPAYTEPFSFASQEYEAGVPVVGTTGPKPGVAVSDKKNFYYRGLTGPAGNEWHVLAVADDDSGFVGTDTEKWASDGKTILFVVDPKTPSLSFTPRTESAQFYTTPAKAYFIPKIHEQTTYLTGEVDIELTNIMGGEIQYRFGDEPFQTYTGPIDSDSLSDGEHTLEYYYDLNHKITRKIVKNPPYPSDKDIFPDGTGHGFLLWKNQEKYDQFLTRCRKGGSLAGTYGWWKSSSWTQHNAANTRLRKGLRENVEAALLNALVVTVDGAAAVPNHAKFGKLMLLDSNLNVDQLGFEVIDVFNPIPSKERTNRGYYDVNIVLQNALAYDLMIRDYRATDFPGGITPIEDYKIRDLLAAFNMESMMLLGAWEGPSVGSASPNPGSGMWDTAKEIGSLITALAMPSYDTPYYGTSGFDRDETPAAHPWTPYPDFPATWKDVFFAKTDKAKDAGLLSEYPNQIRLFNHLEGGIITNYNFSTNRKLADGTVVTEIPPGNFYDRKGYFAYHLMGHCFYILSNIMVNRFDHRYQWLEKAYDHANNGALFGLKVEPGVADDMAPSSFPQYLLINENFPNHAEKAEAFIMSHDPNHNNGKNRQNFITGAFSMTFYNPDWRNYVSGLPPTSTPTPSPTSPATPTPTNTPLTPPTPTPLAAATPVPNEGVNYPNLVFKQNGAANPIELIVLGQDQAVPYYWSGRKDDSTGILLNAFGEQFLTSTVGPEEWFLTNAESQNVILVDDFVAGPVNSWMEAGPSRSTQSLPGSTLFDGGAAGITVPVKYGIMSSVSGGAHDISSYKSKAQLDRHVFFVDDRFFVMFDDMKSLDGQSHKYGWTAHFNGTINTLSTNLARFTKPSGRSLDIYFFGAPVAFENYSIPQVLDLSGKVTNVPYFVANRSGVGTQFLTVLHPRNTGESAMMFSPVTVSKGTAGKMVSGTSTYYAFGQGEPFHTLQIDGKIQAQARLVLAKATGNELEYLFVIDQAGPLSWNGSMLFDDDSRRSYLYRKTADGVAITFMEE